jgi:hypothetical protein
VIENKTKIVRDENAKLIQMISAIGFVENVAVTFPQIHYFAVLCQYVL